MQHITKTLHYKTVNLLDLQAVVLRLGFADMTIHGLTNDVKAVLHGLATLTNRNSPPRKIPVAIASPENLKRTTRSPSTLAQRCQIHDHLHPSTQGTPARRESSSGLADGVYYPTPLHRIMHALREIVYRLRLALYAPSIECAQVFEMQRHHREGQQLADEYARGYLVGWRECFDTCKRAIEEELSNFDDVWNVGGLLAPASTRRHQN